jgi:hypothetical protein
MRLQVVPSWLQPAATWFGSPRGLLQLRFLLLLLAGWWLLAPLSALLAQLLSYGFSRTDAVIIASFCGPLLCIAVIVLGLWPKRLRWVLAALLLGSCLLQFAVGGLL